MDIDTTTPTSAAYIMDDRDKMLLAHGYILSRVRFSKVVEMDTDTFLSVEAPKLKGSRDLYLLMDSATQQVSLIHGDKVIQYKDADVSEVMADDIEKYLRRDDALAWYPNLPFPLVAYKVNKQAKTIVCRIPEHQVIYRNTPTSAMNTKLVDQLWMPPVWMRVRLTQTNSLLNIGVAVVLEDCVDPMKTELYSLPLANIFDDGDVCTGRVSIATSANKDKDITEGEAVQAAYTILFGSHWNTDLLDCSDDLEEIVGNAFDALPDLPVYRDAIDKSSNCAARWYYRLLRVLHEKGGYRHLNLRRLSMGAREWMS